MATRETGSGKGSRTRLQTRKVGSEHLTLRSGLIALTFNTMFFFMSCFGSAFADGTMGSGDVSKADRSDNGVSVNTSRKSNDSNPRVIKTGTAENTFKLGSEQQFLAWERWHHRVGKLLTKLTNNAVAPKQLGIAVVGITIRRDRN